MLAGVAMRETKDADIDAALGLPIAQGLEPLCVLRRLANLDRV